MPTLRLALTDYVGSAHWRWVLADDRGRYLADHTVSLDPTCREYGGFLNLSGYLHYYQEALPPAQQLATLGVWIGERIFGPLREALREHCSLPATAVHVVVPQAAQDLLFRPFELARLDADTSFADVGVRFVYQLDGAPALARPKAPADKALRVLAAFSLPERVRPLNLRRERHGLQKLVFSP